MPRKEWVNAWLNEWVNEWVNECVNEWMSKWIPRCFAVYFRIGRIPFLCKNKRIIGKYIYIFFFCDSCRQNLANEYFWESGDSFRQNLVNLICLNSWSVCFWSIIVSAVFILMARNSRKKRTSVAEMKVW